MTYSRRSPLEIEEYEVDYIGECSAMNEHRGKLSMIEEFRNKPRNDISRQTLHGREREDKEKELEAMTVDELNALVQSLEWVMGRQCPPDDGSDAWYENYGKKIAEYALAANVSQVKQAEEMLRRRRQERGEDTT